MDREAKSLTHTASMLESGPPDSTSTIYVSSTVTVHLRDDAHRTSHTRAATMIESASPVSTSTSYSSIPIYQAAGTNIHTSIIASPITYQAARHETRPTGLPHITAVESQYVEGSLFLSHQIFLLNGALPCLHNASPPARDEDHHTGHGHPHATESESLMRSPNTSYTDSWSKGDQTKSSAGVPRPSYSVSIDARENERNGRGCFGSGPFGHPGTGHATPGPTTEVSSATMTPLRQLC
jgi:hypothetical protein